MDYADARRRMIDGQLRPNKVTDPRLLEAMRSLPRERFLPPALRARAYVDEDVALPGGRAMTEPMVIARLVQLLEIRADDRALVVGAGTGYGAAVLARMGAAVTAVEEDEALAAIAREAFSEFLPATAVRLVDRAPSPSEGAAFDAVLVEGEVPDVPDSVSGLVAEGGRLATVVGAGRRNGVAVLGRRLGGAFTVSPVFDCAVAALPGFAPPPRFVF
ncbi:MAG: protein-L-isoaspartate O-methyltransferase [Acetobacteraceae bacterium]|nr:protein-L-isoaspartate O-methyltransferase [Acetobacteraceae bacterium]